MTYYAGDEYADDDCTSGPIDLDHEADQLRKEEHERDADADDWDPPDDDVRYEGGNPAYDGE